MAIFTKIYPVFAVLWCIYATYQHIKNPHFKNTFDAILGTAVLNLFFTPIMIVIFYFNKYIRQVEWLNETKD